MLADVVHRPHAPRRLGESPYRPVPPVRAFECWVRHLAPEPRLLHERLLVEEATDLLLPYLHARHVLGHQLAFPLVGLLAHEDRGQ